MKMLTLSLLIGLFLNIGHAADLSGISKIFKETFLTEHYEERFCGKNIEKLVRKSIDKNIDLDGAKIMKITDSGGWMFGMVNALYSRDSGQMISPSPTSPPYRLPGEKNWYFHVVLLVNDKILDYDFGNNAKIIKTIDYFHQMFVPENRFQDKTYKKNKMSTYKIELFPAEEYILRQNQRLNTSEISHKLDLVDFLPSFF